MNKIVPIKKQEGKLQIVWGEVYAPDYPDSEGDLMSAEAIRKMAHGFLASGKVNNVDLEHDFERTGAVVVESFIAREDDTLFIPGSWVIGVHIPDPALWQMVEDKEINGFSMAGTSMTTVGEPLEVSIPSEVQGQTTEDSGHSHKFIVFYDEEGNFKGGFTEPHAGEDGGSHYHRILAGSVTEPAGEDNHMHNFSFIELVVDDTEVERDEA